MNHHYCQSCNSTACDGNCARPTDKAAIEAQYRSDCAAVDEDANPRAQAKAYAEIIAPTVHAELLRAHCSFVATRNLFDAHGVDNFIAGAKWALGAVDYEKEAAKL